MTTSETEKQKISLYAFEKEMMEKYPEFKNTIDKPGFVHRIETLMLFYLSGRVGFTRENLEEAFAYAIKYKGIDYDQP